MEEPVWGQRSEGGKERRRVGITHCSLRRKGGRERVVGKADQRLGRVVVNAKQKRGKYRRWNAMQRKKSANRKALNDLGGTGFRVRQKASLPRTKRRRHSREVAIFWRADVLVLVGVIKGPENKQERGKLRRMLGHATKVWKEMRNAPGSHYTTIRGKG